MLVSPWGGCPVNQREALEILSQAVVAESLLRACLVAGPLGMAPCPSVVQAQDPSKVVLVAGGRVQEGQLALHQDDQASNPVVPSVLVLVVLMNAVPSRPS